MMRCLCVSVVLVFALSGVLSQPTWIGARPQSCSGAQAAQGRAEEQATRERTVIVDQLADVLTTLSETRPRQEKFTAPSSACTITRGIYDELDGHMYVVALHRVDWFEARQRCHDCGYNLVRIESDEEQQRIALFLNTTELQNLDERVWMDGTKWGDGDCWLWSTPPGIVPFNAGFTSWQQKQPQANNTQDCVMMYHKSSWNWHDIECHYDTLFMCEMPCCNNNTESVLPSIESVINTKC